MIGSKGPTGRKEGKRQRKRKIEWGWGMLILRREGGERRGAGRTEKPGYLPSGLFHKRVPQVTDTRSWKKLRPRDAR